MSTPAPGRHYFLVRKVEGRIDQAECTRARDNSVLIILQERDCRLESRTRAWQAAWADLLSRGYVELQQARAEGWVPDDWEPEGR